MFAVVSGVELLVRVVFSLGFVLGLVWFAARVARRRNLGGFAAAPTRRRAPRRSTVSTRSLIMSAFGTRRRGGVDADTGSSRGGMLAALLAARAGTGRAERPAAPPVEILGRTGLSRASGLVAVRFGDQVLLVGVAETAAPVVLSSAPLAGFAGFGDDEPSDDLDDLDDLDDDNDDNDIVDGAAATAATAASAPVGSDRVAARPAASYAAAEDIAENIADSIAADAFDEAAFDDDTFDDDTFDDSDHVPDDDLAAVAPPSRSNIPGLQITDPAEFLRALTSRKARG